MKRYKIILVLFLFPLWGLGGLFAQFSNQNYVVTTVPKTQVTDPVKLTDDNSNTAIQYYDGLGRLIETVQRAMTPQKKDLVSTITYDGTGREYQSWSPAPSVNSNGTYMDVNAFQATQKTFYNDVNPYNQTNYEASPLNRVKEQYGAGAAWYTAAKKATTDYATNGSNEVACFMVTSFTASGQLKRTGYFAANTLYKTTVTDEDGKSATEYKDKQGRVVMKRSSTNVDTYFVYNDIDQLCYVLPPLAADGLITATTYMDDNDFLKKYGYLYKYDERGNCAYKRLPGCEPIYMIYDKADRLVLSQDGNQRTKPQWTITKYDVFGRVLYSGIINREIAQSEKDFVHNNCIIEDKGTTNQLTNTGYTCNTFVNEVSPLTVNYYDAYNYFLSVLPSEVKTYLTYSAKSGYSTAFTTSHPSADGISSKGLLTGARTYLLDGSGNYIVSVNYYDDKGRVVQSHSTNHLGGYDIMYNDLDFSGKPNKTLKEHSITGQSAISELYTYTYDHAGRVTKTLYQLNGGTAVTLADMTTAGSYDELGRLKTKKRHNGTDIEKFEYNIRNWTTKITSGTFQEQLFYNTLPTGASGTPLYNGNISYAVSGNTSSMPLKCYTYTYDELNRLKRGDAYNYTTSMSSFEGHFEDFTYDKMGNITYLLRSKTGALLIDFLGYKYNGNQVTSISDNAGSQNSYSIKEYQNKVNTTTEMSYDPNGNLVKDLDRDIVTIRYNILNLPEFTQFKNGNAIKNLYDAGGQKLKSEFYTRVTALSVPLTEGQVLEPVFTSSNYAYTGTVYVGTNEYTISKTYNSNYGGYYTDTYKYSKAYTPEGYVTGSVIVDANNYRDGIQYCYFRKDHLGNNREVWQAAYSNYSGSQPAATLQTTQYYPSGLPWAEGTGASVQNKKYNGKEFIEAHGIDEYDSQARNYYPAGGFTTTLDPLAEKYYSISPYAWCENNPVNRVDLDGKKVIMWMSNIPENKKFYHYAKKMGNNDPLRFDVFAHSNITVIQKGNELIKSPKEFMAEMLKDKDFQRAIAISKATGIKIVVKLHSCFAAAMKDGEGKDVVTNIAKKISEAYPDLIVVAADGAYTILPGENKDPYVEEDKYRSGTWKYLEDGKEIGNSSEKDSYSDDKYIKENEKPKEYDNWGQVRKWFYDKYGM